MIISSINLTVEHPTFAASLNLPMFGTKIALKGMLRGQQGAVYRNTESAGSNKAQRKLSSRTFFLHAFMASRSTRPMMVYNSDQHRIRADILPEISLSRLIIG